MVATLVRFLPGLVCAQDGGCLCRACWRVEQVLLAEEEQQQRQEWETGHQRREDMRALRERMVVAEKTRRRQKLQGMAEKRPTARSSERVVLSGHSTARMSGNCEVPLRDGFSFAVKSQLKDSFWEPVQVLWHG